MTRLLLAAALLLALAPLAPEAHAQRGPDTAPRVHVVQPGETLYRIASTNGLTVARLKAINGLTGDVIRVGQRLRLSAPAASGGEIIDEPPPQRPALRPDPPQTARPEPPRPEPRPQRPEPRPEPVRVRPQPAPEASGGDPGVRRVTHTVSAGETLFRIALRYDTTVEALRQLNGIRGDGIEIGQVLTVTRGGGRTTAAGAPRPIAPRRNWSITRTTVPADLVHFTEPGETLYSIAARYGFSLDALIGQNAVTTAPLVPGTMLVLPEPVDPGAAAERALPEPFAGGLALVFPDVMRGRQTASGEAYDPLAFTASHRDLPFGTVVLVTNPANGRSTFVRVTDRGPVSRAYMVELSAAAATALDLDPNAAREVELRRLP